MSGENGSEGHDPGEGRNHSDPGTAVGRSANNGYGAGTGGWASDRSTAANPMSVDAATAAKNVINQAGPTTVTSNNQTLGIHNVIGMAGGANMSADTARELQDKGWGDTQVNDNGQNVNNVVAVRNTDALLRNVAIPALFGVVPGASTAMAAAQFAASDNKAENVVSFVSNLLANKINGVVGQSFGPEAAAALNGYNQTAAAVNSVSPDASVPSINPGQAVMSSMVDATKSGTGTASASKGNGMEYGGWASASVASPVPETPKAEPVAPASYTPTSLKSGHALGNAMRDSISNRWRIS